MKEKNSRLPRGSRSIAWSLLLLFITTLIPPPLVYAGGPAQPEVQGFTPIGVSDMVDPFTGDFTYNIPLMDVEGYPINIAYSSGVTMDQEASWVGLGWSLNMGAVVRNMRGLPDDFNGDIITKTVTQKPSTTMGVDFGASMEILGYKKDKEGTINSNNDDTIGNSGGTLSAGLGVTYSNYNGFNSEFSFGPSFKFSKFMGLAGTAGFSLSGSSENGPSFKPSLSFDYKLKKGATDEIEMKSTIGASFNSRAGLQEISYSNTMKRTITKTQRNEAGNVTSSKSYNTEGSAGGSYNFGVHSYSPTTGPSMFGFSVSGSANVGVTSFAIDGSYKVGLSYSRQWIPNHLKTKESAAYGYYHLQQGQNNEEALLDFNRDNDGAFTKNSRDLPSAFLTYDLFSVQAQGTGGSFRGFRTDVGYVFDPKVSSNNVSGSFGLEFGLGNLTDFGLDLQFNYTNSNSGVWSNRNEALSEVKFTDDANNLIGEVGFLEANERAVDKDPLMSSQYFGNEPVYFPLAFGLPGLTKLKQRIAQSESNHISLDDNMRTSRVKSNNQLYFLSHSEMKAGLGVSDLPTDYYTGASGHHIGEVTQLGTDGRRYVFGLAAYNHFQEDVTFSVGQELDGSGGHLPSDDFEGLVSYSATDASENNEQGIDHYYSSQNTPPYAHSYMLTAVLSDDYSDSDNDKGPSDGDLGSYVKFDYTKVADHQWRTPINEGLAYYNEGLKTDLTDDKASMVFGEKDLWYVKAVETKNYIAVFEVGYRKDGHSAAGRDGGLDPDVTKTMKKLQKISLYSKADYYKHINDLSQATPIQEVHFVYTNELCQDYPGTFNWGTSTVDDGKLTLKEIYFTYQGSNKMKQRSYKFDYSSFNPTYDLKSVDRWGSYKPNSSGVDSPFNPVMTNADFPYTIQDPTLTDQYATAWQLTDIQLPSGGKIKVEYESDDYGFVQHYQAAQMFKIVAVEQAAGYVPTTGLDGSAEFQSVSADSPGERNKPIYFEMKDPTDDVTEYASVGQMIYFRALMDFREYMSGDYKGKAEYVSGYAEISSLTKVTVGGKTLGRIDLVPEKLSDVGVNEYSPITKAAILFGRMHMSRYISDQPSSNIADDSDQDFLDFANSIAASITSFGEMFTGPNKAIYNKDRGVNLVVNKSFVRLVEPTGKKLGGGSRVKRILMSDNWGAMNGSNNTNDTYQYGQEFKYQLENGRSSGVATYEPQLGGDENPWHRPYIVKNKKLLAMDEKLYLEEPIMESQFPTPTVGYSRVEIRDLARTNVTRTATGKVVKEFYTAKDFPTIVRETEVDARPANSYLPVLPKYQYLTATQGFVIELNDMHGKPKKESVYAENKTAPISTVEYLYQADGLNLAGATNFRLNNTVQVINPDGTSGTATVGVRYDLVADFRESETSSIGGNFQFNTNGLLLGFLPIVIPSVYPKLDISQNRFRSATLNKVVQRFGILKSTRADQDGSKVETNNLAYDAETGDVLVTQTATDFEDKVYSLNYPAYWKYEQLGSAYKNIQYSYQVTGFSNSGFTSIPNSSNLFQVGDEVSVQKANYTSTFTPFKAWVVERNPNGIVLHDKQGNPVVVDAAVVKVIRSGYRNKQGTSMASITTLENPIPGLATNKFSKVLNAGAVEFGQNWRTYCDCFTTGSALSSNPYVTGVKGNWRPVKSFTHLSGRSQSDYDDNTNIRKDGVFTSYTPYYQVNQGTWNVVGQNWTYVSEVTQFSPNGMTLETRDALGRYSASLFGFNNTLTTAVAANTKLRELAVGNFEDFDNTNCTDINFFKVSDSDQISETESHSGRRSIKVSESNPVIFSNTLSECESASSRSCNLTASYSQTSSTVDGTSQYLTIENGQTPLDVQVQTINGSCTAGSAGSNKIQLYFEAGVYNEMLLTVTDANGCQATIKVVTDIKGTVTHTIINSGQN